MSPTHPTPLPRLQPFSLRADWTRKPTEGDVGPVGCCHAGTGLLKPAGDTDREDITYLLRWRKRGLPIWGEWRKCSEVYNSLLRILQINLCSAVSWCLELTGQICFSICVKGLCKWGCGVLNSTLSCSVKPWVTKESLCLAKWKGKTKTSEDWTRSTSLSYLHGMLWRQRWNRWDNRRRESVREGERDTSGLYLLQFSITGYFCVTTEGKADLGLRPDEFDHTLSLL